MSSRLSRLLPVALLGLLAGCGYHFPGAVSFPTGIDTVYLDAQPSDTPLAENLNDILRREDVIRLVDSPDQADAILRVEGGQITSNAAAIDRQGVATEYDVAVRADYRLLRTGAAVNGTDQGGTGQEDAEQEEGEGETGLDQEADRVLRRGDGLEVSQTVPFEATTSPAAEEANKRRVGRQASEELAREILSNIQSGF